MILTTPWGDSTDSIVAGFQYGFAQLGQPIPDRETVRGTIGYLLEDAYELLTGDGDPDHKAQFRACFLEVAKPRQREETTLFPGAAELLRGLHSRGVRLGIVSTKTGETIEYIMERYGLKDTLEFVIGSYDVTRHKPTPGGDSQGPGPDGGLQGGLPLLRGHSAGRGSRPAAGVDFAAVLNGTTPAEEFAPLALCADRPGPARPGPGTGAERIERPPDAMHPGVFRLSEKSKDFSDSLKECRYFPAAARRKSPRCAR